MATYDDGIDISLPAAADLSGQQHNFVLIAADGRVNVASAATDDIIGILQNKPAAAGRAARVRVAGVSKLEMGAAVNEGDRLTSDSSGRGVATTTAANTISAMCLVASGAAGDVVKVLLPCPGLYAIT